jgi:pyroglutamyl-peptidase
MKAAMRRSNVLVTGFGPFPGAPENISGWLAETLPALPLGATLHAEVLATEWAIASVRGPELLDRHQPRLVLHLGVSQHARGFRIERSAHNRIGVREDAGGAVPLRQTVLERGRPRLDTALPASDLAKHLRGLGYPATASRSAGSYLCNYLYYLSLDWAARQAGLRDVCFVHVPPGPRQGGPISEAGLLRGTEAILRYLLTTAERRDDVCGARGELGR